MALAAGSSSAHSAAAAAAAAAPVSSPGARWSVLAFVGMALTFLGERVIAVGKPRAITTILGLLLVVVSLVVRAARAARATGGRKIVERRLLAFGALGLFAVLLYFLQSDLSALAGG